MSQEIHPNHEPLGRLSRSDRISQSVSIFAVLSLAISLRILALLSLRHSIYFDDLLWDERVYHELAERIASGTYDSKSVYFFSPLPAYLFALVYKLFSVDVLYIRILNVALGAATCYFVYLTGNEIFGRRTGIISSIVAALYQPFIFYSIVPLKTALSVFLFSAAIYLLVSIINHTSWLKVLFLGMIAGLLLNVLGNYVITIPTLFLCIAHNAYTLPRSKFFGVCSVYIAGLLLTISPFAARNYFVAGKFAPTTSQIGYHIYLGNNLANKDPYYRPLPFASSSPFDQEIQFTIEASKRTNRKLNTQEASHYWANETLKSARDNPLPFLRKLVQKALALCNRFEAGDHYHIDFISSFVPFFRIPLLAFWCLFPLGIAALIMNARRSRNSRYLAAILIAYCLPLIIVFPNARYRLPILIILIPFFVRGISDIAASLKAERIRRLALYISLVILFVVIEFLPLRGTNDLTAYYNTHAVILSSRGFEKEAIHYWEQSSLMNKSYSAYADLSLAALYLNKGDTPKALHYLDKIPDSSFAAAIRYLIQGDIYVSEKNREKAIEAYRRSLEINSGIKETRKKLIEIYLNIDKKKASEEFQNLKYIASFYDLM